MPEEGVQVDKVGVFQVAGNDLMCKVTAFVASEFEMQVRDYLKEHL